MVIISPSLHMLLVAFLSNQACVSKNLYDKASGAMTVAFLLVLNACF